MAHTERTSSNLLLISMVVALVLFVALGLWFFLGNREPVGPESTATVNAVEGEAATVDKLVVSSWDFQAADSTVIVGTAENNSDQTFSEVRVRFAVLDADGNRLDTVSLAGGRPLSPGQRWDFRIPVTLPGAARAEFQHIGGTTVPAGAAPDTTAR